MLPVSWLSEMAMTASRSLTVLPVTQSAARSQAAGNVVTSNTNDGIDLSSAQQTVIQGNWIGTDSSGGVGLGNGADGVTFENGASASVIGLMANDITTPVDQNPTANVIANNGSSGVSVLGGTGDTIRGNIIYGNGGPTHQGLAISVGGGTTYKPNALPPPPRATRMRA